jgi:thymidylate kinase
MMPIIDTVLESCKRKEIIYLHWKSNIELLNILQNGGEYDILVNEQDKHNFDQILKDNRFIEFILPASLSVKYVYHYYCWDSCIQNFVHLHIYYKIFTGMSIVKELHIPWENKVLANFTMLANMRVIKPEYELLLFQLRSLYKSRNIYEKALMPINRQAYDEEYSYIVSKCNPNDYDDLVDDSIPLLATRELIERIVYRSIYNFSKRELKHIQKNLCEYRYLNKYSLMIKVFVSAFTHATYKYIYKTKLKSLRTGFVIAFVGAEASGKTTSINNTISWLKPHFKMCNYHIGKPPRNAISKFISIFEPLLKRRYSQHTNTYRVKQGQKQITESMLYAFRAVILAYDRKRLYQIIKRNKDNGYICLIDRWPSKKLGAMDSPRIVVDYKKKQTISSKVIFALSKLERNIYEDIGNPGLLIKLRVSPEIAVSRNRLRIKKNTESDEYVKERHGEDSMPEYEHTNVHFIDTSVSESETMVAVKNLIWSQMGQYQGD